MSHQEADVTGSAPVIDHRAAFERIRNDLSELDSVIADLRTKAERLETSAASRLSLGSWEPPAESAPEVEEAAATVAEPVDAPVSDVVPDVEEPVDAPAESAPDVESAATVPEPVDAPVSGVLPDVEEATATVAEPVDAPLDPPALTLVEAAADERTAADAPAFGNLERETAAAGTHSAPVELELIAAPALDDDPETDPKLPPVDDGRSEPTLAAQDRTVLGGEHAVEKTAVGDVLAGNHDEGPEFGDMSSRVAQRMPDGWNGPGDDDAAFDRFFSDAIEPEPAQRWLLDD